MAPKLTYEELEQRIKKLEQEAVKRKQAEEALKESRERLELALKGADLGMWDYYILSDELILDERAIELMGAYPKNDAELDALIHPDDLKPYDDVWDAVMEGREASYIFEYRVKNPSGQYKWLMDKGKVVERDRNGGPTRATGTLQDITKRKQTEKEKAKLESQLRQTQKMESIGTLAGGIAHDFNNILSAIMGYTELALEGVERGSRLYNNMQEVFLAGNRARNLVKQILAFSRQAEQERIPVQMKQIINEVLKFMRASFPTTIEIRQNIQSDALVLADPIQIHQVLMNLCTNADHAMRKKGGVLEVKLENIELDTYFSDIQPDIKPGAYINLTVSDTGHGMQPDVLERIFDPFFTTKETGEGTGMGLSVVHGIIGSYEGAITAYSEPGQGSTFKVYLPIIERRQEPRAGDEESIPTPTGSERILFVDDEPVLANMGKQILDSLGYDVETRTSSIEALELFKAQPDRFDLVITDMTMPHMTGVDLAQELMRLRPNISIILCTGFSTQIDEQKASAMGIRGIAFKPIIKQKLASMVRKVLDQTVEKTQGL